MKRNDIITGDALEQLRQLPDESVHCVVTSPPYYGLRDYGVDGQIGLEETPEQYIEKLVTVFREVRRVLRSDGTVWLNLGDSYASSPTSVHDDSFQKEWDTREGNKRINKIGNGYKPKDLMMMPARVAIALQADGWWIRSDIIWHKPNPMPESVTDRPTRSHEHIFMLTKAARYWYDADAIRENSIDPESHRGMTKRNPYSLGATDPNGLGRTRVGFAKLEGRTYPTRNKRDVWTVATQNYPDAHFATFPIALIEPCILAGCPETCCAECGAGYVRLTERELIDAPEWEPYAGSKSNGENNNHPYKRISGNINRYRQAGGDHDNPFPQRKTIGWQPACSCYEHLWPSDGKVSLNKLPHEPGIVLDPFGGAGTTAIAALKHNRDYLLIELSAEYAGLAQKRIREYQQALQNADPLQPIVYTDGSKQLSLFDSEIGKMLT